MTMNFKMSSFMPLAIFFAFQNRKILLCLSIIHFMNDEWELIYDLEKKKKSLLPSEIFTYKLYKIHTSKYT